MTIAFVPVAFGYGTTARCLAVAEELRRRGHPCVFLAGRSIHGAIATRGFPVHPIPDVDIRADSRRIPEQQLFAQEDAPGFLRRQLDLTVAGLHDLGAELVVYSNSNTAALAASVVGIPSISLLAPAILRIPSLAMALPMIRKWLLFDLLRARAPLRKPVPSAFIGDRTFIPSIPPLVEWPILLPPGLWLHRSEAQCVGPLLTQSPDCLPPRSDLLGELGVGSPFVYATLGGAIFDRELIGAIARGIRDSGSYGLVSGGSAVTSEVASTLSGDRIHVVRHLPDGLRAVAAADVLIWHGGDQTMQEAVASGTPAIGLPHQLDQLPNVETLARAGGGLKLSPRGLRADAIARAIAEIRDNPRYRQRMSELRAIARRYRGAAEVADAAERLSR